MRIFLCGLGLNGKTTLLSRYPEKKSLSFSSNSIYGSLDGLNNGERTDAITKYRSDRYLNESNDYELIDRSIIDQLCMYMVFGLGPIRRSNVFQPILDNLDKYFKEDDVIILIDGSNNKDLIPIFDDNLNPGRKGAYRDLEEYRINSKVFNAAFLSILESKIHGIEHHFVELESFKDLDKVADIIERKFNGN